jgi:2-polyprenyl-3-methyl-5-hydroxy-6-metoxy-1,4-benzoquinol methylase
MMQQIKQCVVCGSTQFEPFLICKDYTVSQQSFKIVSCGGCGFKFTNPRPADSDIGNYYKSENYVSHTNTKKGIVNRLYHFVRNYTLSKKLSLLSNYVSRGTMLDYGCGTGMFLSVCKDAGWNTLGMEPDSGARKLAADRNLPVYENKERLEPLIQDGSLNAITLWHVLEHVTDMESTLSFFKRKLSDKGVLIIAVPNYRSYDAQYYKEHWAAYDVPRHLHHFELNSIQSLLSNHGFSLSGTKPMKFDSFYVSLLSEKYKTGSTNLLWAFITGLRSNLKAKTPADYSSVVYLFRKS